MRTLATVFACFFMISCSASIKQDSFPSPNFDNYVFSGHGFKLVLNDNWRITEGSDFYRKYIEANRSDFGSETSDILSDNTNLIFKANQIGLADDEGLFTCFDMKSDIDLSTLNFEQSDYILHKAALLSYVSLSMRGLKAIKPERKNLNGLNSYVWEFVRMDKVVVYANFLSNEFIVTCAAIYSQAERQVIDDMLHSISPI